ncbi:RNA-binding protein [Alteromonadaceae bacterium M269]|nr:RNA-binding protein [Alteromonadaceae bacterium M269]
MSFSPVNIITIIILALIGFFVGPMLFSPDMLNIAFAVGIVIGSIATMLVQANIQGTANSDSEESNTTTLYVGNLPYKANEDAVQDHFEQVAKVSSVRLMKDKRTGKRKGYGFVEVESRGANKAINKLNDQEFQQRNLVVRLAKEKVVQ